MKTWATNCWGWDDRGADFQCLVCDYSHDGRDRDPDAVPADSTMILLVTREIAARNEASAFQVSSV